MDNIEVTVSKLGGESLTERADRYIEVKQNLKTLNASLKDVKDSFIEADKIESLANELKALKIKRAITLPEIDELELKKKDLESEAELLMLVIAHDLKEEMPTMLEGVELHEITHNGYKFVLRDKLIVKKDKK